MAMLRKTPNKVARGKRKGVSSKSQSGKSKRSKSNSNLVNKLKSVNTDLVAMSMGWKDEEMRELAMKAFSSGRSRLAKNKSLTQSQIRAIQNFFHKGYEKQKFGKLSADDVKLLKRFASNAKKLGLIK